MDMKTYLESKLRKVLLNGKCLIKRPLKVF
jgi:hypothetical protein